MARKRGYKKKNKIKEDTNQITVKESTRNQSKQSNGKASSSRDCYCMCDLIYPFTFLFFFYYFHFSFILFLLFQVFWDYENCPCPMSAKVSGLIKEVKTTIDDTLGRTLSKRINLYAPMHRVHDKTRGDLIDCGVILMDVATKRKQESVDKRIIADIGIWAADLAFAGLFLFIYLFIFCFIFQTLFFVLPNLRGLGVVGLFLFGFYFCFCEYIQTHPNINNNSGEIGIIALISGDSDFGYILSQLRDRSYISKILLFTSSNAKDSLTIHGDFVYRMFFPLSGRDNPFSLQNQELIESRSFIRARDDEEYVEQNSRREEYYGKNDNYYENRGYYRSGGKNRSHYHSNQQRGFSNAGHGHQSHGPQRRTQIDLVKVRGEIKTRSHSPDRYLLNLFFVVLFYQN